MNPLIFKLIPYKGFSGFKPIIPYFFPFFRFREHMVRFLYPANPDLISSFYKCLLMGDSCLLLYFLYKEQCFVSPS